MTDAEELRETIEGVQDTLDRMERHVERREAEQRQRKRLRELDAKIDRIKAKQEPIARGFGVQQPSENGDGSTWNVFAQEQP